MARRREAIFKPVENMRAHLAGSRAANIAIASLLAGALAALAASGCGGGSAAFTPPPGQPPSPSALTIVTPSPVARAVVGQPFTTKLQATGGTPPYTWSVQALGISGISFSSDGTLSGTPTQAGSFLPIFTVTDSRGANLAEGLEFDVIAPLAFATPATLPDPGYANHSGHI